MSRPARFVVLYHDHPAPHYDWMFESEAGLLRTFRACAPPDAVGPEGIDLEPLPDHRAEYLTYEGPISGGRGTVRRVAAGVYRACDDGMALPCGTAVRFSGGRWRATRGG